MYCLFLDLSFPEGICALFKDAVVVNERRLSRSDSRHPCSFWQEFLDREKISLEEIAFFACGVGPGSFTGIRNAVATVKGASLSMNKPIVALSSLFLYLPEGEGRFCIAVEGGAGGIYSQCVERSSGIYTFSSPSQQKEFSFPEDAIAVSPSFNWYKNILETRIKQKAHVVTIAKIAFQEWERGHRYTAQTLPVRYLRKTQAELKARREG